MGGSSKSSSSSATQSVNEDNRVAGDNGAVVLGKDATLIKNDYFSDNVLEVAKGLIELVEKAGEVVVKNSDQTQINSQKTLEAFTAAIQNDKQGTSTTETTLIKYIPLIIGGVLAVIALNMLFRKKG